MTDEERSELIRLLSQIPTYRANGERRHPTNVLGDAIRVIRDHQQKDGEDD